MRSVLFVTLILSTITCCTAQSDVSLSLQGGLSIGHSWLVGQQANELDFAWKCNCDTPLYTGLYVAPFVGVDLKFLSFVRAGLQAGIQSISTSGINYIDTIPYLDKDGNVRASLLESTGRVEVFDVLTRLFVGVELPLQFTVEIGINPLLNLSTNRSRMLRIVSNDTLTFVDDLGGTISADRRTIEFDYGEITQFPSIRCDIDVSVGRLFTFGDASLHPQVLYRHGFANLTPSNRLFSRALAGTLSFSYKL